MIEYNMKLKPLVHVMFYRRFNMAAAVFLHLRCSWAWTPLRSTSRASKVHDVNAFPQHPRDVRLKHDPRCSFLDLWSGVWLSRGPPRDHQRGEARSRGGLWLVDNQEEEGGLETIFIRWNIPFLEYHCVFGILQNFLSFLESIWNIGNLVGQSWRWTRALVCVLYFCACVFWRGVMRRVITARPKSSPGTTMQLTTTTRPRTAKRKCTIDPNGDGYGTSSLS